MKQGKEPIKNKRYEVLKELTISQQNQFALNDKQLKYLKENGLEHRFIHQKEYLTKNNYHRSGWRIVPDPEFPGANAEGLIAIGDLVMAVKTVEAQEAHRRELARKRAIYANQPGLQKAAKRDLEKAMRSSGLDGEVIEEMVDEDTED